MLNIKMKILKGHVSPETAYVVEDYPYGFRLRCKIRYWLEYKSGKGVRFCSQTTNPKMTGEYWNKPKYSTYHLAGCMYLADETDFVSWSSFSPYNMGEMHDWIKTYGEGVPPECMLSLRRFVAKTAYDATIKSGGSTTAGIEKAKEAIIHIV
jgi:hypothetical protein